MSMLMKPGPLVWMDGKQIPFEQATTHVASHALMYGTAAFETIRVYALPAGPALFCVEKHFQRLARTCHIMRMPLPYGVAELASAAGELAGANRHQGGCIVRPLVHRGLSSIKVDPRKCPIHVSMMTLEWGALYGDALHHGADVMVSSWHKPAPNTFPTLAKVAGNYINAVLMAMEVNDNGYTEAIALTVDGTLSEGATENLFVVRDGVVCTPPLSASILDGITRQLVLTLCSDLGIPVVERTMPREALYVADEVFLTGTSAEITPVRTVDKVQIGSGKPGPITQRLQQEFFAITTGRSPDRHQWLTPVPR